MWFIVLVKKLGFWAIHVFCWLLLNICLGSLPFIVTFFQGPGGNPFLIGLLCFCFTVTGSGLYSILVNSFKGMQSGNARAIYFLILTLTVFWILVVWTIVLLLPSIVSFLNQSQVYWTSIVFYIFSVLLFMAANSRTISELVNDHMAKNLIMDPVSNSKASGSAMRKSLDDEGEF